MTLLERFKLWLQPEYPNAKPLPPHVANLALCPCLIMFHMHKTTDVTGR